MEQQIADLVFGLNTAWVLLCAFLVLFMQAGFAMLEVGFTRAKNAINILLKNVMDVSFGAIAYFVVGFALMFGTGSLFMGSEGFFLQGLESTMSGLPTMAFFLFQMAFAATAATIVSGAIAERANFLTYLVLSVIITAFIYPIVGHWVWGGGLLAEKGFIDFAGSTVVHSVGGWIALMAAILMGPRSGRFDKANSKDFTGHNIPLATLGVFILWFGWYGFNPGSQLAIVGENASAVATIALNTTLAAAMGGITALILSYFLTKKAQAGITLNGVLAGLVAITAGCAAVSPFGAIVIGVIGAVGMYAATMLLEKLEIDDAVGAFPVHGVAGILGTLSVGLFAVEGGLLSGGGFSLLGTQAYGVVLVALWCLLTSAVVLYVLKAFFGLRVSKDMEKAGLDSQKHGVSAYGDLA